MRLALCGLVMLLLCPAVLYAQQTALQGTVTDPATSEPLPGVSVGLKGTGLGTVTDGNGRYRLEAPADTGTLVFSFVGYNRQEVAINHHTVLNVSLVRSSSDLNEVVVVGYGTQKKSDITGSVASVDEQRLRDMPNTNFAQALQGSVPGLSVDLNSAGAEQNDNAIDIRGPNSILATNKPLIVLDGVPYNGSIAGINPSDIASIEVLKDASSAAIYGSRGSNGVILITTKKGATGKPVISYDGQFGIEDIANLPPMLSPEEFYRFKQTREPGSVTLSEQEIYDSKRFPDWPDLATRQGNRSQHTLGVRGGTENVKYYVSGTYLGVKGVAVNDDFKRLSLRANLEVKLSRWLTFGTNTQSAYLDRSGLPADFNGNFGAYRFNPLTTAFDSSGAPTIYPWPEDVFFENPLSPTLAKNVDHTYEVISNNFLQVDFPFLKGLSYRLNTGVNYRNRDQSTYYGRNTKRGLEAQGLMDQDNGFANNYIIENILSFDRNFGDHHIYFTGLYSYEYNNNKTNSLHAEGFPNDVKTFYQADVALLLQPKASYTQTQLISQMARINYSYKDKYLLTLTGRRDGFSGFGSGEKYGFFPSAAIGWNIMNESFMKNSSLVSNLKLRLSYGTNGNQAVDAYGTLALLDSRPYVNGNTTAPGYVPSSLANPNLGWETTNTANIGIDFGLWQGRLQGTLDMYRSNTYDLLLRRRISPVHGITSIVQNIGKTNNKGMELGLSSINVQKGDFSWSTEANISFYRNKIVGLYGTGGNDTANTWFIGHPINVNFSYIYDGVFQEGDDIANSPQPDAKPGYAKVRDLNGDNKITPDGDRTIIGSRQPSFIWGMGNTFKYKNLSLYVFVRGVEGTNRSNSLLSDNGVQSGVRYNTVKKNWWTPENPTNDFYANAVGANKNGAPIYQSDAFVRIQDISLSYNFGASVLEKLKLSRLRLYVEAHNLVTFTKWTGMDPELNDQEGIPLQKEYMIGLNIGL
ncbi:TonB-dependent receptor [Compostibacter hankyongensis]|uniref:TonB-dependent receptor n=2 Tax=Compostibacter hankyongensis TaxID=1007089 RepID=A0ABP8FJ49_9BACT